MVASSMGGLQEMLDVADRLLLRYADEVELVSMKHRYIDWP
jgi:hypothetical protein